MHPVVAQQAPLSWCPCLLTPHPSGGVRYGPTPFGVNSVLNVYSPAASCQVFSLTTGLGPFNSLSPGPSHITFDRGLVGEPRLSLYSRLQPWDPVINIRSASSDPLLPAWAASSHSLFLGHSTSPSSADPKRKSPIVVRNKVYVRIPCQAYLSLGRL